MAEWNEVLHENPGNLNKIVTKELDEIKNKMTPFYFDHKPLDSPYEPRSWYDVVLQTYKNILVGNDMQDTRAMLTGVATNVLDASWMGTAVDSMIDIREINPQRYIDYENAMGYLNTTSCLILATCHQMQIRVSRHKKIFMEMARIDFPYF